MNTPKRKPQRTCLGCRELKNKDELIRIVRSPEGEVSVDLTGKKNGRGAYLCRHASCLQKAVKSRALGRALKTEIPAETLAHLTEELSRG